MQMYVSMLAIETWVNDVTNVVSLFGCKGKQTEQNDFSCFHHH